MTHSAKPSPGSSYASLHPPGSAPAHDVPARENPTAPGDTNMREASIRDGPFAVELERLERLKSALFIAFDQAGDNGIPAALVDLAATYTSMLRLQQSLKSQAAVTVRSKAPLASVKPR